MFIVCKVAYVEIPQPVLGSARFVDICLRLDCVYVSAPI
jgi:hypothetical protein